MGWLDIFILLVVCSSEVYLLFDFFSAFLEVREIFRDRKRASLAVHVVVVALWYLLNMVGNGDWNHLTIPILIMLYISMFYYGSFWKKIFFAVTGYSVLWISEAVFAVWLHADNEIYKSLSEVPFTIIIIKLLSYIVFLFIKQMGTASEEKMSWKIFFQYLSVPIGSFGIMMGVFYMNMGNVDGEIMKILTTVCFSLILLGNILVFYAFHQYAEKMHQTVEQQVLITRQQADLNYYMQTVKIQEDHAEFVHNTTHYLKAIRELAVKEDYAEILKIVGELDGEVGQMELVPYSSQRILNRILSEKKKEAEKEEIVFDIYVEPGVNFPVVSDADLISMMGNLLDNAIRAAGECKEKRYVKVRIFMQDLSGFCVIKIENSFSGTILKKDGQFITTKKEKGGHGIGIRSVRKKAELYGGYLSCESQDGVFTAVLLLAEKPVEE